MSALFIRRCWCFGPRPAGQSIFATTAFSQLMMLLSERGFAEEVDVLAKPVFPFYLFSISKSVIFFSPIVLEICITTGRIFYFTTKRKITSIHYNMKRKKERGTQVMTGIFSHLLFMSV